MVGLKWVVIASCIWGSAAQATLPDAVGGERQELQTISSWMAHLNFYYPAVEVESTADLHERSARRQTLKELQLLEESLRAGQNLPKGSLVYIACGVVCGEDPPGKCIKCSDGQD